MARQKIYRGASANDGTGDTLRQAGLKINQNFAEIYEFLGAGGDSALNPSTVMGFDSSGLTYDQNGYQSKVSSKTLTANRNVYIPNASGTLLLDSATQTLTNKTLTSPVLTTPQINDTSADHQYIFAVNELSADRTITLPLLTGNDTFTFNAHTQTLTNKTLTSPKVGTSINDTSGNELVKVTATGSAVNEFTVANAATNNPPTLSATGDDTNINININGKGTGSVVLGKLATGYQEITSSGAASTTKSFIIGNSGGVLAVTLADGTTAGEEKKFINKGAGAMTVTPSNFVADSAGVTNFVLSQYQSASIIWEGTNWYLLSTYPQEGGSTGRVAVT